MNYLSASTVKTRIREVGNEGQELALIDVREAGQFGENHMLYAVTCPYSKLEARITELVPRKSAPVVLIDEGDGVSEKAALRLEKLGYTDICILRGGNPSWGEANYEVFQGVNVPSKAFGEVVEHYADTPRIPAQELHAMMARKENMVIVDGRTPEEHNRMSIPDGISVPNAEMIYRIHDLAPKPETTIVVNCAGRTRSIIGAQGLMNAGLPNRVVALKAGTMGWTLAGYDLDHGSNLSYRPTPTDAALDAASGYASHLIETFKLSEIDAKTLGDWGADPSRTLYVLDVRTQEEHASGSVTDSVHAPGGQLVQATDAWCGVLGARVVLVDTAPCARAAMTAHWLKQMGWDVSITDIGSVPDNMMRKVEIPPDVQETEHHLTINHEDLVKAIDEGSVFLIDVDDAMDYRDGHLPGAVWCPRAWIDRLKIPEGKSVVVYSQHEARARLAAIDCVELTDSPVFVLEGGRENWVSEGGALEASPNQPPDEDCIDYLFWVSRRHMGSDEAALTYLRWEENLPAQIEADGDARFTVLLR